MIRATFLIFPYLQRYREGSKFGFSEADLINYILSPTHYFRSSSLKRRCEN